MFLEQLRRICPRFTQQYKAIVLCRTLCRFSDDSSASANECTDAPVKYRLKKQMWQKELEDYISNLDEEGLQKKRELEVTLEMMKLNKQYVPDVIRPIDWKILLTQCEGFAARQRYLKYLCNREIFARKKLYLKKGKSWELNVKEKTELLFAFTWVQRDKQIKWWKGIQAMKSEIPVIIDFSIKTELKEQRRAFIQMQDLLTHNLSHLQPLSIHVTSIENNYRIKHAQDLDAKMFATYHENHFLDVFPHEDLVYLSPDGPPLTEFDQNCIFVIGGSLDSTPRPQLTLNYAREHGIRCASLPILACYKLKSRGSTVLPISCVYKILLDMYLNESWKEAFMTSLPDYFLLRKDVATREDLERRNEILFDKHHKKMLEVTDKVLNILNRE